MDARMVGLVETGGDGWIDGRGWVDRPPYTICKSTVCEFKNGLHIPKIQVNVQFKYINLTFRIKYILRMDRLMVGLVDGLWIYQCMHTDPNSKLVFSLVYIFTSSKSCRL